MSLAAGAMGAESRAQAQALVAESSDGSIRLSLERSGRAVQGTVLFDGAIYSVAGQLTQAPGGFDIEGYVLDDGERLPFLAKKRGRTMFVQGGEEQAKLTVKQGGSFQGDEAGSETNSRPRVKNQAPYRPGSKKAGGRKGYRWVTVRDSRTGVPMARFPRPGSWKEVPNRRPGGPVLLGPKGVKLYHTTANFSFFEDPSVRASFQQAGMRQRRFSSVEAVLQSDIGNIPILRGKKLLKSYPVPSVARARERLVSLMWQVSPTRNSYVALGTDWVDARGKKYFALVDLWIQKDQANHMWAYETRVLEASRSAFEKAKEAMVYAAAHIEFNRSYFAAYNAREKQKAQQSWRQHNQRMAQNQAAFEARNRAMLQQQQATNEAIIGGYRARSEASDRAHKKTIDGIRGVETVRNPSDGRRYEIESGRQRYWVNGQGEYVGSDDAFYDPNRDPSLNNVDWVGAEAE